MTHERQRELLLRYRDQGDQAAKARLMAELPDALRRSVTDSLADEPAEVRERVASAGIGMLEPVVDHIQLDPIRRAEGVDLISETLDPVELEDELGDDPIGKAALAAVEASSATGRSDDVITEETATERSLIIGQVSGLLLPLIRAHHLKGHFGVDHVQADVDRVQELALRCVSRISTIVRGLPDRVILDEKDGIESRVLTDAQVRSIIGFDPTGGYAKAKQEAARVAEKAAAAKRDAQQLAKQRVRARPTRTRRSSSPSVRMTRPAVPPPPAKPKEPSVLDLLTREEEERLMMTLRDNSMLWSQGNAFTDPDQRDQFWDPVTAMLEATDSQALRQMVALVRTGRIRVERGFASEIERILTGK